MNILQFMSDSPFLTAFLVLVFSSTIVRVVYYVRHR